MARYLSISEEATIEEIPLPALPLYRRQWFLAAFWSIVALSMVAVVIGLIIGAAIA
jgi:hypothetical protein